MNTFADAAQLSPTVADATDPVELRTANQREEGQSYNYYCLPFARQISASTSHLFWTKICALIIKNGLMYLLRIFNTRHLSPVHGSGLAVTFVTLVTLILFWLIDWLIDWHTGNKVEFNTVDFVESRQSRPCCFGLVRSTFGQQSWPYRQQCWNFMNINEHRSVKVNLLTAYFVTS